ncbi:hypothetical protein CRE_01551 [Caenorhabditis remanei]|uniref:Sdz-33 F-box domain-containing protein n=1 Tax=Caenorhabditis remanei TaxID=31234 RepID=E3LGE7_CAERE|nr:hypothetical protein CRE_01551 [Caenorhabditis remanei]
MESSLPLFELPDPVAVCVAKQSDFKEKVKLCLCSQQSAGIVKKLNDGIKSISLNFSEDTCDIQMTARDVVSCGGYCIVVFDNETTFRPRRNLREERRSVRDPIQETIDFARRLHESFEVESCSYSINLHNIRGDKVKEFLKRILVIEYQEVVILGRSLLGEREDWLRSDELSFLLEVIKPEASLVINSCIALDFKHSRPFELYSLTYEDALWVTMDDLKLEINSFELNLTRTNFSCKDLNEFMHYWVESGSDANRYLSIGLREDSSFNHIELLDQTDFSSGRSHVGPFYFIKARENGNRKFTFAQLHYNSFLHNVNIKTFEPTSILSANIYEHLQDVEEVRKLRIVRSEVEKLELKYQKTLEEEKCDSEKERIRKELKIVVQSKKLIGCQMDFIRNRWKRVKLSICSKRSAAVVRETKPIIDKISFYYSVANFTYCTIRVDNRTESRCGFLVEFNTEAPFYSRDVQFEKYYQVPDPIQDTLNLSRRFYETFDVRKCEYYLNVESVEGEQLRSFVNRVLVENYQEISIVGKSFDDRMYGWIGSEDLSFLLATVKPEHSFTVNSNVATDFKHDNPFPVHEVSYEDALWVTLDDLKTKLGSCRYLYLQRTNFTWKDINHFIHCWINQEIDIKGRIDIGIRPDCPFNPEELLDQLSSVSGHMSGRFIDGHCYFVRCRNVGNRKKTIAKLHFDHVFHAIHISFFEATHGLSGLIYNHLEDTVEIKKLNNVKLDVEELEKKYQKTMEEEKSEDEKERIQKELKVFTESKVLIDTRINTLRSQWKPLLLNVYSGLLSLAVDTETTIRGTVTFD